MLVQVPSLSTLVVEVPTPVSVVQKKKPDFEHKFNSLQTDFKQLFLQFEASEAIRAD